MKTIIALLAAAMLTATVGVGCDREAEVKKTETVSSPGGKTTETTKTKVESSGDAPPTTSSGASVPK